MDTDAAGLIASYGSFQSSCYFAVAGAAFLAYEYTVTFDLEVNLFWSRKLSMASILFGINRYLSLVGAVMNCPIPLPATLSDTTCASLQYTTAAIHYTQYLPWALFSALRVFVLTSRRWSLASIVFLLSLAPPVLNFVDLGFTTVLNDDYECGLNYSLTTVTENAFTIVSRTGLILSDLLVLAVTWNATYRHSREMKALGQRASLSDILFRNGVKYFVMLMITNVLHLVFSLLSIASNATQQNAGSSITILSEPLTAVLVSRFLIELQEANESMKHQESLASLRSLNLNGFVGSVGSSMPASSRTEQASDGQDRGMAQELPGRWAVPGQRLSNEDKGAQAGTAMEA
ncbi:hypothetical protein C8Q76DRAFT_719744 [Earliella scabrosa]|nr:hypothetical protein C8Q76DRAFT_719744 [Earliella scabrosa]